MVSNIKIGSILPSSNSGYHKFLHNESDMAYITKHDNKDDSVYTAYGSSGALIAQFSSAAVAISSLKYNGFHVTRAQ